MIVLMLSFYQEIERITIRDRVLEEQRAKIQKYFKFEVVNMSICYFSNKVNFKLQFFFEITV